MLQLRCKLHPGQRRFLILVDLVGAGSKGGFIATVSAVLGCIGTLIAVVALLAFWIEV